MQANIVLTYFLFACFKTTVYRRGEITYARLNQVYPEKYLNFDI